MDYFDCPKCGRRLPVSGSVDLDGRSCPVFQCDECVVATEMFGESIDVALTFVVDENGHAFDPASPDGAIDLGRVRTAGVTDRET